VGLKTEIIMPNSLFDKYNKLFASDKPFATPRNAIASLLNSEEFTKFHREFIRIKPLLMCYEGKFRSFTLDDDDNGPVYSVPYNHKLSEEEMGAIIKDVHEKIEESDYACDGVVVRWYDEDAMESLGRDEHNYVNNFEIAYKFPRAHQYSKLIDIEQDIGLMGKLSLTAVFEPVVFDNRVVTHASLGSYERAKKLNLAVGDTVGIQYEIVPYLYLDDFCNENRSGNKPIKLLDKCPYCGSTLELNPEMSCVNKDCPSRIQGKIYTFCERAGIANLGEALIETLFHEKLVTKIEDLFSLKDHKEEFCAIEGLGEKTFKKICKQFDSLELTEAQILSCIGIKSIGPKKSNKISDIYYINELLEVCSEPEDVALREMVNDGITLNLATILYEGVNENANLIMFLMNHVDVAKHKDETGEVVFTGFRNPKFQKHLLENYNLEVSTGVNKQTVLVIARDPSSDSGKLRKAREYNIPVISVPEAYEYYKFKI
jgi:DNA ligase (NAD+)